VSVSFIPVPLATFDPKTNPTARSPTTGVVPVVATDAAVVVVEYAVPTVERSVWRTPEYSANWIAFIVTDVSRVTVMEVLVGQDTVVLMHHISPEANAPADVEVDLAAPRKTQEAVSAAGLEKLDTTGLEAVAALSNTAQATIRLPAVVAAPNVVAASVVPADLLLA
jgi:hypothetical protein